MRDGKLIPFEGVLVQAGLSGFINAVLIKTTNSTRHALLEGVKFVSFAQ